jgi:hypothetical protein
MFMPTPRLLFPYIETQQAQKEITHAEALNRLDAFVMTAVQTRALSTPPVTPVDGQLYLIPPSPAGDWINQAGKVAQRLANVWRFYTPFAGWTLWVIDEQAAYTYTGSVWVQTTVKATDPAALPSYTLATLPAASPAGRMIFVTNTAVGARVVYSDGTKWRLVSTDALIN